MRPFVNCYFLEFFVERAVERTFVREAVSVECGVMERCEERPPDGGLTLTPDLPSELARTMLRPCVEGAAEAEEEEEEEDDDKARLAVERDGNDPRRG